MRRLILLCIVICFQSVSGQSLLKLPFGRAWGEDPSGLLQWAEKVKLSVILELPADRPSLQIFTFQQPGGGIPWDRAPDRGKVHSIEARFHEDRLYELTINFEYPGESPDEVRSRFHRLKGKLEAQMGAFRLNGRAQNVADSFLTREESFHYEPAPRVFLLMAYSSVEDKLRDKGEGRYAVIYHNGPFGPPSVGVLPIKE